MFFDEAKNKMNMALKKRKKEAFSEVRTSSQPPIAAFRGAYAFLSNFYESPLMFLGILYQSA